MLKLDLGCGKSKRKGFLGVDIKNFPSVDIIHNLNQFPYPFKDNEVGEVRMDQVLEHLEDPIKTMEEIYRISRNDAKLTICVPYFRSFYAFIDPTHKNFFGIHWFDYFDPTHKFFKKFHYSNAKLKLLKVVFDMEFMHDLGIIHRIVKKIANKKPNFYEQKLSHLYPLNTLTYFLKVIK